LVELFLGITSRSNASGFTIKIDKWIKKQILQTTDWLTVAFTVAVSLILETTFLLVSSWRNPILKTFLLSIVVGNVIKDFQRMNNI